MLQLVRSDGYKLDIEGLMDITKIEGLDTIDREIVTVKQAFGDGDIRVGSRVPSRIITIYADVIHHEIKATIRRVLREFFRKNYTFELHIYDVEVPLFIPFELDVLNTPFRDDGDLIEVTMSLYCKDPYFRSVFEFGEDIAAIVGGGGFPMILDEFNPLGVYSFANEVFLANDGDSEAYLKAIITATDTVVDFKLMMDEDNFIQLKEPLLAGQEAVIDFNLGTLYINGVNKSNLITKDSSYFYLAIGGDMISYSATQGEDSVNVYLFYNQLYNGVDEI